MRIEVTQTMIDLGIRGRACDCPIALALKPVLPVKYYVRDNGLHLCWRSGNVVTKVLRLPDEANQFIRAFDRGEPVSPFAFDLPIDELVGGTDA